MEILSARNHPRVWQHATEQSVAEAVAQAVATGLEEALSAGRRASLVVSGGKTPVAMWQVLRDLPLEWARVDITLADERWVPADHPDSNGGLVQQHLLQGRAASACWWPLYNGLPLAEALPVQEALFRAHWRQPFDVVVLGMGADAHTASWFPGGQWPEGNGWFMEVPSPVAPNVAQPRLSFTPVALLGARHLLVHTQGADRQAVLAQALMPPPDAAEAQEQWVAQRPIARALWGKERAREPMALHPTAVYVAP
jgi:6-phosphogluconolactonase